MNCIQCRANLQKEWSFCPYCGMVINKGFLGSIDKMVKTMVGNLLGNNTTGNNKLVIKVKQGSPINTQRIQQAPQKPEPVIQLSGELIEPEVSVKRLSNELEINAKMPGIKSLSNTSAIVIGESLELRASSNNKSYFKIISVPSSARIINKSLSNELLTVKVNV